MDYVSLGVQKKLRIKENLKTLQGLGDESMKQVASVMADKVDVYTMLLDSWCENGLAERYSLEEIETGKKCCNSAFDIVDSILIELIEQLPT